MNRHRHHSLFLAFLFSLLGLFFALPGVTANGYAFEGKIEIHSGYDDNVTEIPEGKGFGFIGGQFEGSHSLLTESAPIQAMLGLEGTCQQYFSPERRFRAGAFGRISTGIMKNRIYPALTLAGGVYRNDFIPEDDTDWIEVGLRADMLVNARITIAAEGVYSRLDYRTFFIPSALQSRGGGPVASAFSDSGAGTQGGMGGSAGPGSVDIHRDDELSTARLIGNVFLHPKITVNLTLEAGDNQSTVKQKTFVFTGGSAGLTWKPAESWQLEGIFAYQRADYDHTPGVSDRQDDIWKGGVIVSRNFNRFQVFIQLDWIENESSVPIECYTKRVTQCGLAYLF